jgi:hypothetical protein
MKNDSLEGPKVQLIVASIVANSFPESRLGLGGGFQDLVELIFEDETVIDFDDEGFLAIYEDNKRYWSEYSQSSFIDVANEILQSLANEDYEVFPVVVDGNGEIAQGEQYLESQDSLGELQCSNCQKIGGMKKIIYGMPSSNFNFDKYISGGCCPPESADWIGCQFCKYETNGIEKRVNP